MELNHYEIALQYVSAIRQHQELESALQRAVHLLDPDNQLLVYGPIHKAYDELVSQILGDPLVEHLLVWIYELDFGKLDTRTFKEFYYSHKDSHKNPEHD